MEHKRAPANRVAHPATVLAAGVNFMAENQPARERKAARSGHGWPSFADGKNGVVRALFLHTHRARLRPHHGVLQMTKHKTSVEDAVILKARKHAQKMLDRLVEIANTEPPSHVSIKAAETVIALAREQTDNERNPFGIEWPG